MKNTLRRAIVIVLVLCMATALAVMLSACDKGDRESKLYVGMECGYQPYNYTQMDNSNGAVKIANADGYANGYDVMIAKRIAEALGKELVIYKYEFEALIPAVTAGTLDLIIAGMSPTAKRAQAIDFSDAYYDPNLVIVVRKDSQYANATDLDGFSGAKIAAQLGTFHNDALQAQASAHGILAQTPVIDFPTMTGNLKNRMIDGYVADESGAIADCAANEELTYVHLINNTTGFVATPEDTQIAVGLKKGSSLTAQINAVLAGISETERNTLMAQATAYATGENIAE